MKAVVTIVDVQREGKFQAIIDIKNKFFNDGMESVSSKSFANKKICIKNAEAFCQDLALNYQVVDDTVEADKTKGGKKVGKK